MSKMTIRFDVHPGITVEEIADKLHRAIDAFGVSVEVEREDAYNPDQPRDEQGRFGEGGAAAGKLPGGAGAPQGRRVASRTAEAKQREEASKGSKEFDAGMTDEQRSAAAQAISEKERPDPEIVLERAEKAAKEARQQIDAHVDEADPDDPAAVAKMGKLIENERQAQAALVEARKQDDEAKKQYEQRAAKRAAFEKRLRDGFPDEAKDEKPTYMQKSHPDYYKASAAPTGGAEGAKAEADRLAEREAGRPATRAEARAERAAAQAEWDAKAGERAAAAPAKDPERERRENLRLAAARASKAERAERQRAADAADEKKQADRTEQPGDRPPTRGERYRARDGRS